MLALGHVHESLLSEVILLLVSSVEINAALHDGDELIWRVVLGIPKDGIIWGSTLLWNLTLSSETEVKDGELAASDHGSGDLGEETSHPIVSAVVTSDSMNHLDGVHQGGKNFLDGLRSTILKGLNEFVKSLEILDIVLGLIELLGDSEV